MTSHEITAFKSLATNLGAIFAVTDEGLNEVKFSTSRLTSVIKNSGNALSKNGVPPQTHPSQDIDIDTVSIFITGKKRPIDAIKFSRYIPSKKERICIFFELEHLHGGYKSLKQLMPPTNESQDMLEKFLSLSHRERQVAGLVGSGLTSREIAANLHISENTVKNHRKRLKKRLAFDDSTAYKGFLEWVSLHENKRERIAV